MSKKVILLNGPSSSGKSTLASTLQGLIKDKTSEEYDIISIDDFLKMSTNEMIYENDVFEISSKLCEKSMEILRLKQGIIIDHVITSERIFKQLIASLKSYKIYLIHVTCSLHELKKREEERKNRCIGSAEASYEYLFPKEGYDLVVDTFESSTMECALQIIDILF
jgi:chloramphenicol 3-O phosphotransferase